MCDTYSQNADQLRIDPNERIVKNTEIDQQWADWLAPTRRSFLFGAGAAAVGLTLGDEARADEAKAAAPDVPGPRTAFAALNGPIRPYLSADAGVSEWGHETLKQATVRPRGLWPGTDNGLPAKPRAFTDIKSYHAHFYFDDDSYEKSSLGRRALSRRDGRLEPAAARSAHHAVVLLWLYQRPAAGDRAVGPAEQPRLDDPVASGYG